MFFFSFSHLVSETLGFIGSTSNDGDNTNRYFVRHRSVRSAAPPLPAIARGPFTIRPPTSTMTTSFGEQPYFDFELQRNVTVTVGQTGFLHCRVEQLGDKDVSIIHQCPPNHPTHIVTLYIQKHITQLNSRNRKASTKSHVPFVGS